MALSSYRQLLAKDLPTHRFINAAFIQSFVDNEISYALHRTLRLSVRNDINETYFAPVIKSLTELSNNQKYHSLDKILFQLQDQIKIAKADAGLGKELRDIVVTCLEQIKSRVKSHSITPLAQPTKKPKNPLTEDIIQSHIINKMDAALQHISHDAIRQDIHNQIFVPIIESIEDLKNSALYHTFSDAFDLIKKKMTEVKNHHGIHDTLKKLIVNCLKQTNSVLHDLAKGKTIKIEQKPAIKSVEEKDNEPNSRTHLLELELEEKVFEVSQKEQTLRQRSPSDGLPVAYPFRSDFWNTINQQLSECFKEISGFKTTQHFITNAILEPIRSKLYDTTLSSFTLEETRDNTCADLLDSIKHQLSIFKKQFANKNELDNHFVNSIENVLNNLSDRIIDTYWKVNPDQLAPHTEKMTDGQEKISAAKVKILQDTCGIAASAITCLPATALNISTCGATASDGRLLSCGNYNFFNPIRSTKAFWQDGKTQIGIIRDNKDLLVDEAAVIKRPGFNS